MNAVRHSLGLALAAALAAGCAGLGDAYRRPEVPQPAAWSGQAAAAGWPAADWWTRFGSPELDGFVAVAQAGNHDLRAAAARVDQARALVRSAGATLLPTVTADASAARSKAAGAPAGSSVAAGLGGSYEVDLWGGNRQTLRAAEARLEASRLGADALRVFLTAEVAATYFQVLAVNEQLGRARETLAIVRRLLAAFELLKESGRISALELAQQRTVAANAEAAVPPLLRQRQAAVAALAVLLGRPPQGFAVSEAPLAGLTVPPVPVGAPAELLDRQPDIREAEAALAAAHADIGAARAAVLPRLVLSARAGSTAATVGSLFGPGAGFAVAGADVLATIFDGGRAAARVDLSAARQRELVENYAQTVLTGYREVEQALAAVEHFAALEAAQGEAHRQAGEALRLAELRFRAGGTDHLAVLDAQRARLAAEAGLGNARYLHYASLVELYRAAGGGWVAPTAGSGRL